MPENDPPPHRRRLRYGGKNPRAFALKYKEHRGDAETLAKVLEAGKTPAGAHRPILVEEILAVLQPKAGERFVDATLGFGGHAAAILPRLLPGGVLLGLDVDPMEQPKTVARLRAGGFSEEGLVVRQSNFAGIGKVLGELGWAGADGVLVDLGLSSMQIDDPARGFSVKFDGPLDMRMNPTRGLSAREFIRKVDVEELAELFHENADEPRAEILAGALAGKDFATTGLLRGAIEVATPKPDATATVRRVFQAIRIAVNDEFGALDAFLRILPFCLAPGGRVAFLTFHSGEDRRVKHALKAGMVEGHFSSICRDVIRASAMEVFANPRAASAKLRWAVKAANGATDQG